MARKVTVVVESGKDLYSCFMTGTDDLTFGLIGDGKTAKAAMEDFLIADKEMREFYEEEGKEYPDLEFSLRLRCRGILQLLSAQHLGVCQIYRHERFSFATVCGWHQVAARQESGENSPRHCKDQGRYRHWTLDR